MRLITVRLGQFLSSDSTHESHRFVRAVVSSATAIPQDTVEKGIEQVFHILNNFDISVGAVREEAGGAVHSDYKMHMQYVIGSFMGKNA